MRDAPDGEAPNEAVKNRIRAAGERAKAEADARRKAAGKAAPVPAERDGRDGPEPVRYGDWEVKGTASDF